MQKKNLTLILGGTGKTGRRIVERLEKRGIPVRIGSRSGQPPFDWDNPATWPPVLQDVETVYIAFYPDLAFPGAAATIEAFVHTAVKSGVKRLVLLSGRGEEGALLGPSLMPGGSRESYEHVAEMLNAIAAKVDGVPCCTYIGPDGAGHFVKMVHNGIEYADIQLIAETYDLLRSALGLTPPELAVIFREWNEGRLQSYLIEITGNVLAKASNSNGALVDVIEDEAEQKGTGRWTSESALELGVPLTGITEAVFARVLSSQKAERVKAAGILAGPAASHVHYDRDMGLVDDVRDALYAAKIVAYAQGFEHLQAGSREYEWGLDLGSLATIWRGGCIIRAAFLDRIKDAYVQQPNLPNLMLAPFFQEALASGQDAWRRVVKTAVDRGVPIPAFSSSLAYYDGYRRARGPANLIQGLRDYFGAHTYHRVDREGAFHTRWAQDGAEVKTD